MLWRSGRSWKDGSCAISLDTQMRAAYVTSLVLAAITGVGSLTGCDRCEARFRNLYTVSARGTIACCGGSASQNVMIPDGIDRQVDLANADFLKPSAVSVELWLTRADCDRLFDAPYPGSAPRCPTLIGPVGLDKVSERIKIQPGLYRVFVQAYSSNTTGFEYDGDIGVWGADCHTPTPTAPTRP